MKPRHTLAISTFLLLISSTLFSDDRSIIGRWSCNEPEGSFVLEFRSDGTLNNVSFPGRAKIFFTLDLSGTPAALNFKYALDETKENWQMWLDLLSEDAIQIRRKETDLAVFGQGPLTTLICERQK